MNSINLLDKFLSANNLSNISQNLTISSHHVVYDFFDKINISDHLEDNKDSSFRKINDSLCIEKDMVG